MQSSYLTHCIIHCITGLYSTKDTVQNLKGPLVIGICDLCFTSIHFHKNIVIKCYDLFICLNRVCTRKIFSRSVMLSRLASSIIIFLTLYSVGFFNLLFGCVCVFVCVCVCVCLCVLGGGGAKLPPYLNFSLKTAKDMKLCTGNLQYGWVRIMQIHFLLRSWINKNRQSWIKTQVALLFFSESKQTE